MSWSSGSWDEPGKSGRDPAEEAGSRREEVRRAVIELVRTRRAVAEDQERLDGYLRDVCPNQPGEVAVVVVAGVVSAVVAVSVPVPSSSAGASAKPMTTSASTVAPATRRYSRRTACSRACGQPPTRCAAPRRR